jgi:uncharacterized membrane protein YobD (UPF0266 family)
MEAITNILPIVVLLILIWLMYSNISYAVTIMKARKKDSSLVPCLSKGGMFFYIGLVISYVIALILSIIFILIFFINNENDILLIILNVITVVSLGASYLFQQVIFIGQKQMMIGKITLDYRKIKRVTFPKAYKLQFAYGQKQYQTSLHFIDEGQLRKALHKTK